MALLVATIPVTVLAAAAAAAPAAALFLPSVCFLLGPIVPPMLPVGRPRQAERGWA
eukprot:CAMPEP_0179320706 /NCGR_PEP_ID=MMETSP0797-20121207/58203_1 /TAXON_ID=47934 /ORGANISM="Dinophysis acuminata, Strain DAEP01" /LENGTH=55 /DNA_ID=CAMNT_0021032245 /DNA_START=1 /DNA_END=165 /DNA_ORIENTATION=+